MGVALEGLMRLNESVAALNKAAELDPKDEPTKVLLASVTTLMNEMKYGAAPLSSS